MKKVAPGHLPVQPGAVPPETKTHGDGDLPSSRSGSSQGARRRAKHAKRAKERFTDKEAYEIFHGAAGEFHRARGHSSDDDTRGTRSSISGLRTSLRKARDRLESREELVQDVMARLKFTRDPLHQDVSPDPTGHERHSKAATMSLRRVTSNRGGCRCDIPTPTKSPVSTATEEMHLSAESGSGPLIRGGSWGTKRRVDFDIDDGESEASGSKSLNSKGYTARQTRIAATKKKKEPHRDRAQAAGEPAKSSNTTNRLKKSSGTRVGGEGQ